jgi:hypothetical protein
MTTEVLGRTEGNSWVPTDDSFGARLALIRWKMRWNVKEAALACGVPAASWRLWEEGAQPRRLMEVSGLIANRTGVDLGWLVGGSRLRGQSTSEYFAERRRPPGRVGAAPASRPRENDRPRVLRIPSANRFAA